MCRRSVIIRAVRAKSAKIAQNALIRLHKRIIGAKIISIIPNDEKTEKVYLAAVDETVNSRQ